jgi:hypothetical protein
MTAGLDYSAGPLDPAAILAAGFSCVFRYVDDPNLGLPAKCITLTEYNELVAAGVDVYLVFEHFTDDYTAGFLGGVVNAQRALNGASWLGYSGPIFMAIDTHLELQQLSTAIDYLDGAEHILGGALGVYGFVELIQVCQAQSLGSVLWQCGHEPGTGVHIWQDNTETATVDGVTCDIDRILIPLPETDDMAVVPQAEWNAVYDQLCGLFTAWAGGGTGDPDNPEYDFLQYMLRANVQLTQLTLEVAALKAAIDSLTTGPVTPTVTTSVTLDGAELKRIASEVVNAQLDSLAATLNAQRD